MEYVYEDSNIKDVVFNSGLGLYKYLNATNRHVGMIEYDLDKDTEDCNKSLQPTSENLEKIISDGETLFFINTVPSGMLLFKRKIIL